MTDFVYAASSGVRPWNGSMMHFTEGETWDASDPFVQAHRDLFDAEPKKVRRTRPAPAAGDRVERATRRPGEKRA
jgi:hypothetical protein